MITSKSVLVLCVGVCICAALSPVYAQNGPGSNGVFQKRHSGQRIQEIYSQLNLTDAQKKRLEANKEQHRSRMERSRQEEKSAKEALRGELMLLQLDMQKINEIHRRIKEIQAKMEDDKLSSILAVRSILTPEQFLKFVTLMHRHQ